MRNKTLSIMLIATVAMMLGISACGVKDSQTGESTGIRVNHVMVDGQEIVCITYKGRGIDCNWKEQP